MRHLLERTLKDGIDSASLITHRMPLADAPKGYEIFKHKLEDCVRVVFKP